MGIIRKLRYIWAVPKHRNHRLSLFIKFGTEILLRFPKHPKFSNKDGQRNISLYLPSMVEDIQITPRCLDVIQRFFKLQIKIAFSLSGIIRYETSQRSDRVLSTFQERLNCCP